MGNDQLSKTSSSDSSDSNDSSDSSDSNESSDSRNSNESSDSRNSNESSDSGDADSDEYVAVYDFQSRKENQLSVKRDEKVRVLSSNEKDEWCRVKSCNDKEGWVPIKYITRVNSLEKYPWFHGQMSGIEAEYLLGRNIDGSFIIRESKNHPEKVLSLRHEGIIHHELIFEGLDGKVYIKPNFRFNTLAELVDFYSRNVMRFMVKPLLRNPVLKLYKPAVFSVSPEYDEWQIDRADIEILDKLGSGYFGDVYKGIWKEHNIQVAVKTLKKGTMNSTDFLKEGEIMKEIKHRNLVQLLGVCTTKEPFLIITELMPYGNLLEYLKERSPQEIGVLDQLYIASQIAGAMKYLESRNFIHRDLSARNCLVGENLLVKVADFGLARLIQDDPYKAASGTKMPTKWTAPEGLSQNKFSSKSDVWSFGILLWEIATGGMEPYIGIQVPLEHWLSTGRRLERPKICPQKFYDLMIQCWQWEPSRRPTFKEVLDELHRMHPEISSLTRKTALDLMQSYFLS